MNAGSVLGLDDRGCADTRCCARRSSRRTSSAGRTPSASGPASGSVSRVLQVGVEVQGHERDARELLGRDRRWTPAAASARDPARRRPCRPPGAGVCAPCAGQGRRSPHVAAAAARKSRRFMFQTPLIDSSSRRRQTSSDGGSPRYPACRDSGVSGLRRRSGRDRSTLARRLSIAGRLEPLSELALQLEHATVRAGLAGTSSHRLLTLAYRFRLKSHASCHCPSPLAALC